MTDEVPVTPPTAPAAKADDDKDDGFDEPDDVDNILNNLDDDEVMGRVERLSDENRERLNHYLTTLLDQGFTGTPDKMVMRALRKMKNREYD